MTPCINIKSIKDSMIRFLACYQRLHNIYRNTIIFLIIFTVCSSDRESKVTDYHRKCLIIHVITKLQFYFLCSISIICNFISCRMFIFFFLVKHKIFWFIKKCKSPCWLRFLCMLHPKPNKSFWNALIWNIGSILICKIYY